MSCDIVLLGLIWFTGWWGGLRCGRWGLGNDLGMRAN